MSQSASWVGQPTYRCRSASTDSESSTTYADSTFSQSGNHSAGSIASADLSREQIDARLEEIEEDDFIDLVASMGPTDSLAISMLDGPPIPIPSGADRPVPPMPCEFRSCYKATRRSEYTPSQYAAHLAEVHIRPERPPTLLGCPWCAETFRHDDWGDKLLEARAHHIADKHQRPTGKERRRSGDGHMAEYQRSVGLYVEYSPVKRHKG